MIDFKNATFVKLKRCSEDDVRKVYPLLLNDEQIIAAYKSMRDFCVFTNKRIISANIQGVTGKKRDFTSMPYSNISVYSVESAGVADLDSELELYFTGLGKVKFEFTAGTDIWEIGRIISAQVL